MSSFNHDTNYNVNSPNNNQNAAEDNVKLLGYTPKGKDQSPTAGRNGNANTENGSTEEKEKFISETSTPVKLDPGLDSMDRGAHVMMVEKKAEAFPPIDRFWLVFFIFLIHGMGILMPWNMFITARSYFVDYKLNTTASYTSPYRTEFIFYLGIVSQVSNAVISCMNTFFQFGGQASTRRIAIALFSMVIIFICTVILAMVDSSGWPGIFFTLTMISAGLLNCCAGVYQNSTFGQAAILPMKYTNAIVLGTNLSGVFTSVISIISIVASPNPRTAAVYYFIVAIVVLLIAFDAYFVLPLTKFYQYYKKSVATSPLEQSKMRCQDYMNAFVVSCKTYWVVVKKIWLQLFGVWFVFTITLVLFPAIQSSIVMIRDSETGLPRIFSDDFEKKGLWVAIFCFLSFNLFAFLGNLTSEFVRWPGPKHVWIPIVLRGVVLIPVYVLCNYQPIGASRRFPVLIESDVVFIIAGIVMAFTSGYYSSLTMMYGPKQVEPEMAGRAGMMMAFFLVLGITTGVNFSLVLQKIVTTS